MFNNNHSPPTQTLVHLPRQQQRSPENELPQGECRFILSGEGDGSRQRCTCVSFSLNKTIPGSLCGCGHQAWHHIKESAGGFVSIGDHHAALDKVRKLEEQTRQLQEDAIRERKEREKMSKELQQGYYQNLYYMRYYVDEKMEKLRLHMEDKVDGLEDRATEIIELKKQLLDMDEIIMRLEERLDSSVRPTPSLTPLLEGKATPPHPSSSDRIAPELPFRTSTERHFPDAWECRVILVPSKYLSFAFSYDNIPYRRCQTRGLHQDLQLRDRTSETFTKVIEANFMTILRRRPWMPLQCLRSSDMSLTRLRPEHTDPAQWNYTFLEAQCLAHDKLQGDVIFIALQQEDLTWDDIRSFPKVFGSDDSCWEFNEDWDRKSKDDRMETDRPLPDTESTYSSPPPYTSRASMYSPDTPRQGPIRANPLDVLATASLANSHPQAPSLSGRSHYSAPGAPSISERSNYSAPSIISEHSVSSMASIDSTLALSEADEHRAKRTKRGIFLRSPSSSTPSNIGNVQSAPNSPPQTQIYYSGRSKRKIPANKHKDPMDWRPSEMSFKNLLHRHDSRRPTTSGSSSHAPSHEEQQQHQQQQQ